MSAAVRLAAASAASLSPRCGAALTSVGRPLVLGKNLVCVMKQQVRLGGGGPPKFSIVTGRWNWDQTKDYMSFYVLIFGGACLAITTYANVFVGPAKLSPIPEGYHPRPEEYSRHPITRFMIWSGATCGHQQGYELHLHGMWEAEKHKRLAMLRQEVRRLMREDGDYKGYYYSPFSARQIRVITKLHDDNKIARGLSPDS